MLVISTESLGMSNYSRNKLQPINGILKKQSIKLLRLEIIEICDVNINKKRSNLTQQYADIYLLQSHSTCFGRHSTHHQEY